MDLEEELAEAEVDLIDTLLQSKQHTKVREAQVSGSEDDKDLIQMIALTPVCIS